MIRITGGKHRGRPIETADDDAVRPTGLRARQAVFNRLQHGLLSTGGAPLAEVRAIDLFAGSGAMGLEALSRGAEHVTFIEADAAATRRIVRTLANFGETEHAQVIGRDCLSPPQATTPCTLVFVDPPYRSGLGPRGLAAVRRAGWIASGAIVVAEVAANEPFPAPEGFALEEERAYGAARMVFLRAT